MPRPGGRARRILTRAAHVLRDPAGAGERFFERRDRRIEAAGPAPRYDPDPDWERRLHQWLGAEWPCPAAREFEQLWPGIVRLVEAKGLRFGPQSFYGWNDGDPKFVGATWCLVRHLRPSRIVETGVAHGVSTRLVLEALERNGHGTLWSIDPPPVERRMAGEIAVAVDGFAPHRWHLVAGSSRRVLPGLLAGLGQVDLFLHDSLHTRRNVCFEVAHAMAALPRGGFVMIDDIDTNWGFHALREQFPSARSLVCQSEPVRPDLRRFDGKGLFGVMQVAG